MVGQWMGKARKMASEFQASSTKRCARPRWPTSEELDEVKEVATRLTSGNVMTSLQKDVSDAMQIGDIDKPKRAVAGARRRAIGRDRRTGRANTPAHDPETFVEPRPMRRPPSRSRSPVKSKHRGHQSTAGHHSAAGHRSRRPRDAKAS